MDGSGNVYTTGNFMDIVDFDHEPGTAELTSAGNPDVFISKLDSSGNYVWAKRIGGTDSDNGRSIAVDNGGNVYTAGEFSDTVDFDPGPGTADLTSAGSYDIFVSKKESRGNYIWAKRLGGASSIECHGMTVDTGGNVYTTGFFKGTADFDPGPGSANLTSLGNDNIFVSKLDSNGDYVWAVAMGGVSGDYHGHGIAVDVSGNVYTTGLFEGTTDFDPGPGTAELTPVGKSDIYVSKLDSNGNYVWAKRLGGTSSDQGRGIALDAIGDVYTTGLFGGVADFDPGAGTANLTSAGSSDIYVSKLDSSGNYVWAKRIGGTGIMNMASEIAVDGSGNALTTGAFSDTVDFDPGPGTAELTSSGSVDVFVSKLGTPVVGTPVVGTAANGSGDGGDEAFSEKKTIQTDFTGGTYSFGRVKVIIPDGALNSNCQLVIKEAVSGNFQLGDQVYDIKIICGGQVVSQFNKPIQICVRPKDGVVAGKQLFHQPTGISAFSLLPTAKGPKGYVCGDTNSFSLFALGKLQLPGTGFPPGSQVTIPEHPIHEANTIYDRLLLEIPALNLELPIVGVPLTGHGWDVTWLGDQAGYLEGTAYPTWVGNTAITAHVWDVNNQPGPFINLHTLKHGDQIRIHANGQIYTYEVSDVLEVKPDTLKALQHSEYDMLTLITCKGFNASSGEYDWRLAVQAVLINIE